MFKFVYFGVMIGRRRDSAEQEKLKRETEIREEELEEQNEKGDRNFYELTDEEENF